MVRIKFKLKGKNAFFLHVFDLYVADKSFGGFARTRHKLTGPFKIFEYAYISLMIICSPNAVSILITNQNRCTHSGNKKLYFVFKRFKEKALFNKTYMMKYFEFSSSSFNIIFISKRSLSIR